MFSLRLRHLFRTFTRRTDADLVAHSGYLCLDFDHLDEMPVPNGPRVITPCGRLDEVRRLLLDDPHFETLLLFTSPSGTGLKWVIEIGAADSPLPLLGKGPGIGVVHRTWFTALRNYLATTYHLDADRACINVSRCCFLPHDPDCYIAPRLLPELEPFTGVPSATCESCDGESGGQGRFNGSGGASPCDPCAERGNPAVLDLMTSLCATNIKIENNEQSE